MRVDALTSFGSRDDHADPPPRKRAESPVDVHSETLPPRPCTPCGVTSPFGSVTGQVAEGESSLAARPFMSYQHTCFLGLSLPHGNGLPAGPPRAAHSHSPRVGSRLPCAAQ